MRSMENEDLFDIEPQEKEYSGAKQPPGGWTKHSPAGGITINGKFFGGGKFIPNEDLAKASPEELENLKKNQELVKKFGVKKAKEMIKSGKTQDKPKAAEGEANIIVPKEYQPYLYLVDDGTLMGNPDHFGALVIRGEGEIRKEEFNMLNALATQRFDIISSEVTSLTPPWDNPEKIPLNEYKLLNNIPEEIKNVLVHKNKEQEQEHEVNTAIRMSLLDKNTWEAELNEKPIILYSYPDNSSTLQALAVNRIYRLMNLPTPQLQLAPGEDNALYSEFPSSTVEYPKDEIPQKLFKTYVANIIFGNPHAFDKDLGQTKFFPGQDIPNNVEHFNGVDEECKDICNSEKIEELLNDISYPIEEREGLKKQILGRLEMLEKVKKLREYLCQR